MGTDVTFLLPAARRKKPIAFLPTMVALGFGTLVTLISATAYAAEQRCNELGANCVCSEPVNTATLGSVVSGFWLNPPDSTVKECATTGTGGNAIEANPINVVTTGNDPWVLGALPAGHSVQHYMRGVDDHSNDGIWWFGQDNVDALGQIPTKRIAVRLYLYHSSASLGDPNDFEFIGDGACTNTKFFGRVGIVGNLHPQNVNFYGFADWTYQGGSQQVGDCCFTGPPDTTRSGPIRGKWMRYEMVYTNRAGGAAPNGITFKLYEKNVTDNLPEVLIVDSTVWDPNVGPNNAWLDYTVNSENDLTPPSPFSDFTMNSFRQGFCRGYRAFSHYMVAAWDTDAGQRVGPAREIEGGGGATLPQTPATPTVKKK